MRRVRGLSFNDAGLHVPAVASDEGEMVAQIHDVALHSRAPDGRHQLSGVRRDAPRVALASGWKPSPRMIMNIYEAIEAIAMNEASTQPDRDEHGPKQLRADRQVLARSRFALVSGGYSWSFSAAGCAARFATSRIGRVSRAVCVLASFIEWRGSARAVGVRSGERTPCSISRQQPEPAKCGAVESSSPAGNGACPPIPAPRRSGEPSL